jgi:pimeloyl-ACP methyl ester carboxylesterase
MLNFSFLLLLKLPLLLVGLSSVLYLSACGYLFWQQRQMIYQPQAIVEVTPTDFSLAHEEIWLPVQNGDRVEQIHGWWLAATQPHAPVLLFLHGNSSNIGANLTQAVRFQQMGFSVLTFDYRGYGQSKGKFPHEAQMYQDAQVAWQYLAQERRISTQQIFIYGHSMGGAVAIELALHHPEAAGLIVESSFTSLQETIEQTTNYHIFPIQWLLTERFDSIAKVPQLQVPVLFIHGTADTRVPFSMSEKLFTATATPKQLYLVPEAGHNNVAEVAGAGYRQTVQKFVRAAQTQKFSLLTN